MILILTHEKADFDAIASQLAAKKLFPKATPLLSRHLNRNVQQFLNLYWDALPFLRAQEWRKKRVDDIILVDTQNLNSVRGIVKNPQVRVIDHHIGQKERQGWDYTVEAVGATTTILVEMLQLAGLYLTAEEATLLLLGIFEDTGSLTYDTATARDARAAAWLFEQGAQLTVVRRFLTIPLTPAQQTLYEELQSNAEWLRIRGRPVVLAAAKAPSKFKDEISSIAHRLRETLTPDGLFVLVQLGNDVQVVARSSHEDIDVAVAAEALGGGGHSRAAAALVINSSISSVAGRIKNLLPECIKPMTRVSEIMSFGVQTVDPDLTVKEAARMMQRSGHEGYPVVTTDSARITGLLTRHAVDRAMNHELGHLPIKRIMKAGSFTVQPSDSIEKVQELMLNEGWGQIPVISDQAGKMGEDVSPIGIVTRTDLLNHLFKPVSESAATDLRDLLEDSLPSSFWALVQAVSAAAVELNMPLYFVGGLVRDLLLDMPAVDLDMVVEGDAIELVKGLQKRFGGQIHTHSRFGTAKWFVSKEIWDQFVGTFSEQDDREISHHDQKYLPDEVDFVTARSEFYTEPSALPEVERGSIKLDLHRRDFTINTLAIRLDGAYMGQLLDFYGGRRDLEKGLIRVLHSLSFIDDPTRILRAVRLEQRLNFRIEERTLELLRESLPMLSKVTGSRIRSEIELALSETNPLLVMERLDRLGVMSHIQKGLKWKEASADYYACLPQFKENPIWQEVYNDAGQEFLYFSLWINPLPLEVQEKTVRRLRGRKSTRDDVLAVETLLQSLREMPPDPTPSQLSRICRSHAERVLLAARIVLDGEPLGAHLDNYFRTLRFIKPALTGDDLKQMDLKPGPAFNIYLSRLLDARLDGDVETVEQEQSLLKKVRAELGHDK